MTETKDEYPVHIVARRLSNARFALAFGQEHFGCWFISNLTTSEALLCMQLLHSGIFGAFCNIEAAQNNRSGMVEFKITAEVTEDELDRFDQLIMHVLASRALLEIR